jgi:hypothetical protein
LGRYCCKSPKSNNPKNLTKVTSPHTKRISGSEDFRSSTQKDFFQQYRLPAQPVDATLYLKGEMECGLMGRRFHGGFTATEKTELWDRWKRGESLKAIGRAFGKPSSSVYFLVAPHGGFVLPSGVAPGWH